MTAKPACFPLSAPLLVITEGTPPAGVEIVVWTTTGGEEAAVTVTDPGLTAEEVIGGTTMLPRVELEGPV